MEISPIQNTRALRIALENELVLAVSDLHLGISAELSKKGIEIPSRIPKTQKRLLKIIEDEKANRLFLLGDVKHNIPVTSWEEWENLPDFFSELRKRVKVEIVPGNHDGDIEGLIPRGVTLHESSGTTISDGRIGLLHGHAWPDPKLFQSEALISGHNHPAIEFKDGLETRVMEPAWIKTTLKPENLPEKFRKEVNKNELEIMIIPAFNKLVEGGAINREIPEKLLGPLFKNDAINLEDAEVHLLDGTFLGKLKNLRNISSSEGPQKNNQKLES